MIVHLILFADDTHISICKHTNIYLINLLLKIII